MPGIFSFRAGEQIGQRETGLSLLQKYWKTFAPRDIHEFNQRIRNSEDCMIAAYDGDVLAGLLEAMRLDIGGNPQAVPSTFNELTGGGTWSTHKASGDTVMLVDLTIAPRYHGAGLFEAFVEFAGRSLHSACGVVLTYSPLFPGIHRYWVTHKHEHLGARLSREMRWARPGLTMNVAGEEVSAEDVGIMAYSV